jgi:zinc protease
MAGLDYNLIRIYCQREFLNDSLRLLKEILFNAVYDADEFEHMRQVRKSNISQQLSKNTQLASMNLHNKLFGSGHPYGYILQPEDLDGIDVGQLKKYHEKQLFHEAKCSIVGEPDEAGLGLITQIMQRLKRRDPENTISHPFASDFNKTLIQKAGSNQASVRMGGFTSPQKHPDEDKLKIAVTLLGGFFGSRLMKVIREEKGLTYGIYATVNHHYHADYWQIGTEVQLDKSEETLEAINHEINRLATVPCDIKELNVLKSYMKGTILSSMDNILSISQMYTRLWISEKSVSDIEKYLQAIDSIAPDEISEMIHKYLSVPPKSVVVVQ